MTPAADPLFTQLQSKNDDEARLALDALFDATYVKLVRFAVSYAGSLESSEDVVGEVFMAIWANRTTLTVQGSLEAYLFGAVRRRAISVYRHGARHTRRDTPMLADGEHWGMGVPPDTPDAGLLCHDTRDLLWRAIAELPERQREILALRWQGELGWEDVARVLESTTAAVQMQHSRALKTLRARLANEP